ncbi:39S ribosomal protein L52, mitochondrial [Hylaeus volcanicus]|uniref:39S ribosomal protein L52, mitochondrial n=1 Tax=Hylaeus volcanicus TaxID=313075 RepID=UPI0023B77C2E|nr:39S ribosomal protein L52, mitochondrial [Hylaeus volcanicus]
MSSTRIMTVLRTAHCKNVATTVNGFHSSAATYLNQYWRKMKGLSPNPNKNGPLVNLPDYSFRDNRPVPYGQNQFKRFQKQQEHAKRIVQLVGEIDYAVEKHAKMIKQREETVQKILNSKLKPKGQELVNK